MKMTELIQLPSLISKLRNRSLPIRTAYKFTKLANIVETEAIFYQEQFTKIIQDYGQQDENGYVFSEDGSTIAIIPGKEEECKQKINELQSIEVEASGITFTLEELENLDLTMSELQILFPLITE